VRGRLIPLTSLVAITSGIYINDTALDAILNIVPSIPHIITGMRSKLKIYETITIKMNYLIK
jgi:hypothetical protein